MYISDLDWDELKSFIYKESSKCGISEKDAHDLLMCAEKYDIQSLKKILTGDKKNFLVNVLGSVSTGLFMALEKLAELYPKGEQMEIKKIIHPALIALVKLQRQYHIHILNDQPKTGKNVIYAVNHSCKDDFPVTCEVIENHTYVLVGKQHLRLVDRACFHLNGVVYVDRKNKANKNRAKRIIIKHLSRGNNICIYPEGTWNLTPSMPMLPLYWGIIDIARETNCPIIPLVLEYRGCDCYIKWGMPVYVTLENDKQNKISELSDKMATLKWDIWELFSLASRKNIDQDEWGQVIQSRLMGYPYLDHEYEKSCILRI